MRNSLVGTLAILFASLMIGCGGSGGGSAATPGATAQAATGAPVQVPQGFWSNQINLNNPGLFVQFLQNNGLCGFSCGNISQRLMAISIDTTSLPNGMLPGMVSFTIAPVGNSASGTFQPGVRLTGGNSFQTPGCGNTSNSGFVLNYFSLGQNFNNSYYSGLNYGNNGAINGQCQLATNPGQVPTLQVTATYGEGSRDTLDVQVLYNGALIASGPVGGTVNTWNGPDRWNQGPQAWGGAPALAPFIGPSQPGQVWVYQQRGIFIH